MLGFFDARDIKTKAGFMPIGSELWMDISGLRVVSADNSALIWLDLELLVLLDLFFEPISDIRDAFGFCEGEGTDLVISDCCWC